MEFEFRGEVWFWRGPAPWHFVSVPEDACDAIREISPAVTYGWGMIPVAVRIGSSEWTTSLWPKDGGYLVPVKSWVRSAEHLEVGDEAHVRLVVGAASPVE